MIGRRRWILRWFGGFWLMAFLSFLVIDRGMAEPWQLAPRLAISERYDDNILLAETDPETDEVTTVTPGFSLSYKGETVKLGAQYDAVIETFARHEELNNVGHTGSIKFENNQFLGSKTTSVSLQDAFQFVPQLLPNQPESPGVVTVPVPSANGIGLPRNSTWVNTAALTATHLSSARLTERVEYLNSIIRFEHSTLIDSTVHEGTAEAIYQLDPNSEVSGSYRFRYFDFAQQESDNATSHALMTGITHRFSPTLSLTAKLGASYSIQSKEWYITPIGVLRLSKTAEKLEVVADYSRDVSDLTGLAAQLVTTQTATVSLSYPLAQKARATLNAGLADNESITGPELKIVSWTIGTGLSYQVLRWLSAEVRYYHFEQRAKGGLGNDFTQNQYIFSLTGSVPWNLGGG